MANKNTRVCPKCKAKLLIYMYGCFFDYDSWTCMNIACDYVEELDVSTMPEEVNDEVV